MAALTRLALLAGVLASTTQAADHLRAPHPKPRRQASGSALPSSPSYDFQFSPATTTTSSSASLLPLPSFSYAPPPSLSSAPSAPPPSFSYAPTATATPANGTCGGKTLNVYEASLDWWYPQTYTYIASTFIVQYDAAGSPTGWVLEPAATPFDVSSAVAAPSCTTTAVLSTTTSVCTTTYPPVAASTTVLTQTAYTTITATTGTGAPPNLAVTPTPAAITIPAGGGNYSAGTPFVFFSRYAIITKSPTTYPGGSVGCATSTNVYPMSAPFSFEYTGGDVNGTLVVNEGVVGDVNPAFLGIVNVTSVIAGSWVAEPTVAVVVSKVVAVSQLYLATPTATLATTPSGGSGGSATGGGSDTAAPTLVPQTSLQLPTVTSATGGANGGGSGGGAATTTSINTGSPTNALEVLTAAEATFSPSNALQVLTAANPTAAAILSGLSGPASVSAAGGANSGSSSTITLAGPAPALTIAGKVYPPVNPTGGPTYVIAGQTLTPGGSMVFTAANGAVVTMSMNAAGNSAYAGISGATQASSLGVVPTGTGSGAGAGTSSKSSGVAVATGAAGLARGAPFGAAASGAWVVGVVFGGLSLGLAVGL